VLRFTKTRIHSLSQMVVLVYVTCRDLVATCMFMRSDAEFDSKFAISTFSIEPIFDSGHVEESVTAGPDLSFFFAAGERVFAGELDPSERLRVVVTLGIDGRGVSHLVVRV
jgi:hypothetical protein